MFLKVKTVTALADMKLSVEFAEGVTKIYDVSPLLGRLPVFRLLEEWDLFEGVEVDAGDTASCGTMTSTYRVTLCKP